MGQTWFCTKKSFKGFIIILYFSIIVISVNGQEIDYKKEFGDDYTEAVNYLLENQWMADSILVYDVDPYFTLSIIFPELIRYNALSDYFETKALEVLYIQYGNQYADFSIGRFQIKPSFAENIEYEYKRIFKTFPVSFGNMCTADNSDCRNLRIKRLKKQKDQLLYLIMFLRLMDKKYAYIKWYSVIDKLKFYATTYNTGLNKSESEIKKEVKCKRFHTAMIEPTEFWNYADICVYFYKQLLLLKKGG